MAKYKTKNQSNNKNLEKQHQQQQKQKMHGTCMARLFPDRMIPSSWDGWMGTPWGGEAES